MDIFCFLSVLLFLRQGYCNMTCVEVNLAEELEIDDILIFPDLNVFNNIHSEKTMFTTNILNDYSLPHYTGTAKSTYEITQLPYGKPLSNTEYKQKRNSKSCSTDKCGSKSNYVCKNSECTLKMPKQESESDCSTSSCDSCSDSETGSDSYSSDSTESDSYTDESGSRSDSESSENDQRKVSQKKNSRNNRQFYGHSGCCSYLHFNASLSSSDTDTEYDMEDESDSYDNGDDQNDVSLPEEEYHSVKEESNSERSIHKNILSFKKSLSNNLLVNNEDADKTVYFTSDWWEREEKSLEKILITATDAKHTWEQFTGESSEKIFWTLAPVALVSAWVF